MKVLYTVAVMLALVSRSLGAEGGNVLNWERLPDLPDREGFAGAFAGIVREGESGHLVVAGGANFPAGRPWEGGKKVYYRDLYSLELREGASWEKVEGMWPETVAYGMSVSLPDGSCLFLGGKSVREVGGPEFALASAYRVTRSAGTFVAETVPDLPLPCVEGVAGLVGDTVVVAAGATADEGGGFRTTKTVWTLDTSKPVADWAWESRSWPEGARGRVYAVGGVHKESFFLFGGRDFAASDDPAEERFGTLDFLRDCYAFQPGEGTWRRLADLPRGLSAAPASAIPSGVSHLLMVGGVDAGFLHQQVAARPEKNGQGDEHPGFARGILAYDTITDTWVERGSLAAEIDGKVTWAPVTTPVVAWKGRFLVPTGEIKPGVRAPQVLRATVEARRASFGVLNWVVVAVYLLGMVAVGYWFMKREAASSTEAYFRGSQQVPFLVAGLSIFATVLSSITFMSIPARAYQTDISWYVGQLTMLAIVPVVAFCYLPFFRKLDLTSAYLYLERRFNLAVRLFGSLSFIILHLGRIAIVLYLPAVALSAVSNIDVNAAILIIGILCVIYTVMGGIEAVVWTDAVQAVVLMGGALLCLLMVLFQVDGGMGGVIEIANADRKLLQGLHAGIDIGNGTTSLIVLVVALFFSSFLQYTSGQDVVQRYVTTKDVASARKSLWTTMWMSVFGSLVFFLLGTALYAFYKTRPELLDPAMSAGDGILPFFIMQQLPTGVAGVIIAAVFAASQSSVSSSLNSVATAWTKDFDARLLRPGARDADYLFSAKMAVSVAGVLGIGIAIAMANAGIENAFKSFIGIIGLSSGALGGVFALGVFTRRANGRGALAGACAGMAAVAGVKFSAVDVTTILYAFIGFASCFVIGYLVSLVAGGESRSEGLSLRA